MFERTDSWTFGELSITLRLGGGPKNIDRPSDQSKWRAWSAAARWLAMPVTTQLNERSHKSTAGGDRSVTFPLRWYLTRALCHHACGYYSMDRSSSAYRGGGTACQASNGQIWLFGNWRSGESVHSHSGQSAVHAHAGISSQCFASLTVITCRYAFAMQYGAFLMKFAWINGNVCICID